MTTHITEKLTKIPTIPHGFGDDGGKFYKYYAELADKLDDGMVTSLKPQLDGILIFAGTFAGVNSAFLAFTLPQMRADPAEDTNAFLFQIMLGGNRTIASPADLPSATFSPPAGALSINVLFSLSLTLALLASFLAVLGQQWLVYYRKRSGSGPAHQRWEQLRRYLGAKRWRLELVLDDVLPSVIQIALVIFCVAFILYLGTLSSTLCYAIIAPLLVAGALVLAMAIFTAWDNWCPFKSPLTHLLQPVLKHSALPISQAVALPTAFISTTAEWLIHKARHGNDHFSLAWPDGSDREEFGPKAVAWYKFRSFTNWSKDHSQKDAEATDGLELVALRRVFCTSEDSNTLVQATTNAQSIVGRALLEQVLNDDTFRNRLESLDRYFINEFKDQFEMVQDWAMASTFFYIVLSAGSAEDFLHSDDRLLLQHLREDQKYDSVLVDKLRAKINPLGDLLVRRYPLPVECEKCHHCTLLTSCITLAFMILSSDRHMMTLGSMDERSFEKLTPVAGDPKSFGDGWVEALRITTSKEWDNFCVGRKLVDRKIEIRAWRLERFRGFLRTYQEIDMPKFVHIINDAIAISTCRWVGRPDHGVYVALFKQLISVLGILKTEKPTFYPLGSTLNSLLGLLRAIEIQIRNAATPADNRELEREWRSSCVNEWTEFLSASVEGEVYYYGPLWFHCVEASDSLQTYLKWLKSTIETDPSNEDNSPLVEFAKDLLDRLPNPDDAVSQLKTSELELKAEEMGRLAEDKIKAYRQLHLVFTTTMGEIETTVSAATNSASEEQVTEAHPQPEQVAL